MKVLIVDDHVLLRDGLTALLAHFGPDTEVLTAADGAAALEIAARESNLDIAIVDLAMPGLGGAALIEAFAERHPDLPLVVLSASENAADVRRVMSLGALGYVPKSASPETLLSAFKLVLAVYVPALLREEAPAPSAADGIAKLTPRQADVLACMCRGLSNKAAARELAMSEKTVKTHVTAILRALGATNRAQAATIARAAMART